MPAGKIRPAVICPFYRGEEGRFVFCEGIRPGFSIRMSLGKDARTWRCERCRNDWKACPVAQMLTEISKSS